MSIRFFFSASTSRFVICVSLAALLGIAPVIGSGFSPQLGQARAQAQEPVDFHSALEGYGQWVQHPRWGEVWIPEQVGPDWQPYRLGKWVYTDEWGWYWDSTEDFGWVTYHYGRWIFDRSFGWVWVPNDEWAPAWVNWRQGDDVVGWAPLPPDELIDEDENPDTYMFVRAGDLVAPEIYTVILPARERFNYFHRCRVVNRSFALRDGRRIGVNPGIPPAFIARANGRPFRSVSITPVVLGGTVGVAGAIMLREGFRDRERTRVRLQETNRSFQPNDRFQMPKGLARGERGRLGDAPLNATRGGNGFQPGTQKNFGKGDSFGPKNFGGTPGSQEKQFRTQDNQPKLQQKNIETSPKGDFRSNDREKFKKQDSQQNLQQKNIQTQGSPNTRQLEDSKQRELRKQNQQKSFQQQNQQKTFQQQNAQPKIQQQNVQPKIQQQNVQPRVQQSAPVRVQPQPQNTQRSPAPPAGKPKAPAGTEKEVPK
jgi:hypothetical protein